MESVHEVHNKGDDRFGVAIRERTGPRRRRGFRLTVVFFPGLLLRYDGATESGAHRQRQSRTLWQSVTSREESREEAASQGENEGWERPKHRAHSAARPYMTLEGIRRAIKYRYSYSSRAPMESLCTPHALLERAERLAGMPTPGFCVACSSEPGGGGRPPHREELARGYPITEARGS